MCDGNGKEMSATINLSWCKSHQHHQVYRLLLSSRMLLSPLVEYEKNHVRLSSLLLKGGVSKKMTNLKQIGELFLCIFIAPIRVMDLVISVHP